MHILLVESKADLIRWQAGLIVTSHKLHRSFGLELSRISHFQLLREGHATCVPTQVHLELLIKDSCRGDGGGRLSHQFRPFQGLKRE